MGEVKKIEAIFVEHKVLLSEALVLATSSRQRSLGKVKNPVIVKEIQKELDALAELRRAVNTL